MTQPGRPTGRRGAQPRWARPCRPANAPGDARSGAADVLGWLALLGLGAFVVCYSYERAFYETFGISPEDVGQGYQVIVGKAATGAALIAALIAPAGAAPWLNRVVLGRSTRPRLAVAAGVTAASAGFAAALAAVSGLSVRNAAAVGAAIGALAAVERLLAAPAAEPRATPRAPGQVRAGTLAAAAAPLLALVVAAAWHAGAADGRRVLALPRADPYASIWQAWLGMNTPAANVTWTMPGAPAPASAPVRLLGSADQVLVMFDLDACVLRRLPSAATAAASRIGGAVLGPPSAEASPLPRCPRS